MRLRRYVPLQKSISIVSFGGTCRVLRAHDTAASSLADDCFAVFGGSATMRLRRYVSLEKSIRIVMVGGTCRVFHAHDIAALSVARDRFALPDGFAVISHPGLTIATEESNDSTLSVQWSVPSCSRLRRLFSRPLDRISRACGPSAWMLCSRSTGTAFLAIIFRIQSFWSKSRHILARQVEPSLFDPRFLRSFVLPRHLA